ncbi:hypothetical protein [Vibrio phage VpKK5]|uniref:hypothetical protein n=1 Tax=Vibrio phage VpKK5 TaxID=1538804 RepID=UPI0004F8A368|nr:hypothetical protein VC55_gp55 [Vibrio phage VpKK5]AIM40557.1 hypothetical protein [Vibrio phage VpKK5]
MAMTLLEALGKLDPTNEDHWTADGLPRIDPLSEMVGIAVQRQSVTAVAPEFTRSNQTLPTTVATGTATPEPEVKLNPKQDQELADEGAPQFNEPTPDPDPEPEEVLAKAKTSKNALDEASALVNAAEQKVRAAQRELAAARKNYTAVARKFRKTPAQKRVEVRSAVKRYQQSEAKRRAGRK